MLGTALAQTNEVPADPAVPPATNQSTNAVTGLDAETRELKAGDVLRFIVEEDPTRGNQPFSVAVTEAGEAFFPVTRGDPSTVKLNVRGKKLAQVRSEVKQLLDAEFYQDCTLQLDLNDVRATGQQSLAFGKVTVFGEMRGVVGLPEGEKRTISDVILQVGESPTANLKKVRIHRVDPQTNTTQRIDVNVHEILYEGKRANDVEVLDGDRIEIRAKTFLF